LAQDKLEAETGHLPRLMNEQLGQILVTAAGFLDRLVLTAILFRIWGTERFELWSAALAFAGFGSLFEFGFNLYYNNRITFETERGEHDAAKTTLYEANAVFAICAIGGVIILSVVAVLTKAAPPGEALLATILLSAAGALRLVVIGPTAQYRANRQYARFAFLSAIGEVLRIGAIAVVVLAGAGLLGAALAAFLAQLTMPVLVIFRDSKRRFQPHQIGFRMPRGESLREAMAMSGAYFGQLLPVIFFGSVPILFLQSQPRTAGVIASFVLVRTLANLARTPLQSFGVVIGQECGRRIAIGDKGGALAALAGGARMFAVLGGLACGIVAMGGSAIVRLWTGDPSLFTLPLATAAMAPMLFGSVSVLTHNVLVSSNAPFLAMIARWLQVLVTVIAWVLLPGVDAGLRLMSALAAGELLGYQPLAFFAVNRLIHGSGIEFHIFYIALSLVSALVSGLLCLGFTMMLGGQIVALVAALGLATLGSSIWGLALAFNTETRMQIIDTIKVRVFGRAA
jgi:hypothetical protein